MQNQATAAAAPAADTVDSLIKKAGEQHATMLDSIKAAAKLAAVELDKTKSTADAHKAVMTAHATALAGVDHNVKALFSDALWLLAASATAVVEIMAPNADKKANPVQIKAADALDTSKHNLRSAAQQVREQVGAGRAKKEKAAAPAAAPAAPAVVQYDVLFADAGEVAKAVAALERIGYSVTKKGKTVKATPAANAPTPGLAALAKGKEAILAATA